ncbi:MAG: T9SS type A sorting domain-containing protein [Bacteroidota bacterium]
MLGSYSLRIVVIAFTLLAIVISAHAQSPRYSYAKQGFSMRLQWNNCGAMGHIAYRPFNPAFPGGAPFDSLGFEYPIGSNVEHLYGGGLWIGGKLDTSRFGDAPQVKLVSTTFEGWSGPYFEFFPGSTSSDTIWKIDGRTQPKPAGWDEYWQGGLEYRPLSDNDHYCTFTDTARQVTGHIPLQLKVIQSSFVWSSSDADGIHIKELRIINVGKKIIDSAYVGIMIEAGIMRPDVPFFPIRNITGYLPAQYMAWVDNPVDSGTTPIGVTLLRGRTPRDSLRITFAHFSGPQTPPTDAAKFSLMSSALIYPDQYPTLSEGRFMISAGPFTLNARSGIAPSDTLVFAFALIAAPDLYGLPYRARRAQALYDGRNSGGEVPQQFLLEQNYPNPFNGNTIIRYSLPADSHVRMKIFSPLGQEVATIVDEMRPAGLHYSAWSAKNDKGGLAASGMYFCRMEATTSSGTIAQTKRIVLLR